MVLARDSARPRAPEDDPPEQTGNSTLDEVGANKTGALCNAIGFTLAQRLQAQQLFHYLTSPWAKRISCTSPSWPSDITDDGTPFELSVAFTGSAPKFRLLVESQSETIEDHS